MWIYFIYFFRFTVTLPNEGTEENLHCTMNYNHTNKLIKISTPLQDLKKTEEFEIHYEEGEGKEILMLSS